MILMKDFTLRTGKVSVKARRTGGNEGFLLFFNAGGIDNFMFANAGAAGNRFTAIQDRGDRPGGFYQGGLSTPGPIENGRWYDVSLVVGRDKAELFLDGKKVAEAGIENPPAFFANAGYDRNSRSVVVKATNYNKWPVNTEIRLDGVSQVAPSGKHVFLCADQPYAENSLDQPRLIVPQERTLTGSAREFRVSLSPYSVNVLRIPAVPAKPSSDRISP